MDSLELRVPPVALMLLCGVAMWVLAWLFPSLRWPFAGQNAVAIVALMSGVAVAVVGVVQFRRSRTTVNPMTPGASTALVVTGVYRQTRNPMYLGFLLMLIALAVWLANLASLFVLPMFVAYMNRFQILPEERALAARFGQQFEDYRRSVRRWL